MKARLLTTTTAMLLLLCCALSFDSQTLVAAEQLKVHGIFRSNMVLQRDKPISVWGWAPAGRQVRVTFGEHSRDTKATGENGRWEVVFDPQPANAQGQKLQVQAGDDAIVMENILIGDGWVMNGQSNMAFALKAVYEAPLEASAEKSRR